MSADAIMWLVLLIAGLCLFGSLLAVLIHPEDRALALPDIQAKLKEGGNIATPTTPEGMRQQMADEIANWRQVIEANNIKVN